MREVQLTAEARQGKGSAVSRRLRTEGKVPAVLYGHGIEPQALTVDARSLRSALSQEAGMNALLSLDVSGDRHLAMARQLQRHPVRGTLAHVDFVVVGRDEIVSAEVPIHLVGEAEDVQRHDGMIEQQLFTLEVNSTPGNIPSQIDVDISALKVGDSVRVGDLKLPSGVTTDLDAEEPVLMATASTLAAEVAADEAEAEAEAEAAAPTEEAEGEGEGGDESGGSEG
jgi:large subunit ribosomal protein L25